jgi:hypothetical protein
MCNAWNHYSSCCCGFGGETYSRGIAVGESSQLTSYESYINPFAKCPVCRVHVFFFQATNGGRVFFDELGPPWPKHPCTDRSADHLPVEIDRPQGRALGATAPTWEKEGWSPFLLREVYLPRGERRYRVSGMIITASQKSMATILMESAFAARVSDWANRWEPTAPTFVRRVGKACELSGVTLKGTQIKEHFLKQ